ncbi:hypothetical protein ZIOFF_037485 [Zingiber officinale]|uniref:Inositol polyphosphate-related phosphatase domain-containing protein n=1 Tax=Zingiber officinale TaxID=94328 RepID=A0A8J5L460_ZINOF|nr:hypothetical protein ZIOFF_037485 [Zingiber officinale]
MITYPFPCGFCLRSHLYLLNFESVYCDLGFSRQHGMLEEILPMRDLASVTSFLLMITQIYMFWGNLNEIVPLNAGNVLVIEDNEPAAKWLSLINQALNGAGDTETDIESHSSSPYIDSASRGALLFQKLPLKAVSKTFKTEQGRRLRACNCPAEATRKPTSSKQKYCLIASKQMVGIFVTVWVRRELVQHIGHLRVACIGRGIMGWLGMHLGESVVAPNKLLLHLQSLGFGGERRRRAEKEFRRFRNTETHTIQEGLQKSRDFIYFLRLLSRVIWLGDLNYRISLSYSETKKLLEDNNWHELFEKDQLKIEREAGRVFKGWNEGKIYFAPTYKYSNNSDTYAGEGATSKKKRRTPAWCDRILWNGDGIAQLSYIRGESKFSDHRPVCAVFVVEVGVNDDRSKNLTTPNMRVGAEEILNSRGGSC